jgi:hypothetical protein
MADISKRSRSGNSKLKIFIFLANYKFVWIRRRSCKLHLGKRQTTPGRVGPDIQHSDPMVFHTYKKIKNEIGLNEVASLLLIAIFVSWLVYIILSLW